MFCITAGGIRVDKASGNLVKGCTAITCLGSCIGSGSGEESCFGDLGFQRLIEPDAGVCWTGVCTSSGIYPP